jgi:hypothetical protein
MRSSQEKLDDPRESGEQEKLPRSVLQNIRSKFVSETLIALSLLNVGAFAGEPLEAQQRGHAETYQTRPYERRESRTPEQEESERKEKIARMSQVLEILRESQPQQIEPELIKFYGEDAVRRIKNPERFLSENSLRGETKLPETIPFEGGVITREQLREYIDTLPEGWQNCFEEIRYSDTDPTIGDGIHVRAEVLDRGRYAVFYRDTKNSGLQAVLKVISHETAHKAIGKYIAYNDPVPDGSAELSERALYAVMQRLQASDHYQGGSEAGYLDIIKTRHMSNYRLANEYLAIVAAQYFEGSERLAYADVRLVAALSAIDTKRFPVPAVAHQKRAKIFREIKQANSSSYLTKMPPRMPPRQR